MSPPQHRPPLFRIVKGTHISHFHDRCPGWPMENFYEQDKPLWWGIVCQHCGTLAEDESRRTSSQHRNAGSSSPGNLE